MKLIEKEENEELIRIFNESTSRPKQYGIVTDKDVKDDINSLIQQSFVVIGGEDNDDTKEANALHRLKAIEHLTHAALELEKLK